MSILVVHHYYFEYLSAQDQETVSITSNTAKDPPAQDQETNGISITKITRQGSPRARS